jgi:hypothetical protein
LQIYANWLNLIMNVVFPVALMTTLNVKIYRAMRSFHKGATPPNNPTGGGATVTQG